MHACPTCYAIIPVKPVVRVLCCNHLYLCVPFCPYSESLYGTVVYANTSRFLKIGAITQVQGYPWIFGIYQWYYFSLTTWVALYLVQSFSAYNTPSIFAKNSWSTSSKCVTCAYCCRPFLEDTKARPNVRAGRPLNITILVHLNN